LGSQIAAIPQSVVALGFVSLFMDVASEIIHSLLPVFFCLSSRASALSVGFIDGVAEAASQLPEAPLRLWADRAKVRQVLLNLLSNALKFTEPGGTVSVSAEAASDHSVTIRVIDNGMGMSVEQIPIAFAAFGQVDSRLARRYEGTGLGLPLSKALVQLHGGTIAIESTPGEGTTVIVTLPKEPAQATAEAA